MERKNEGPKRLGICFRLVNFIVESLRFQTFRQVTPGRTDKREESNHPLMATTIEGLQYDGEEGEVALVPPIIVIPVEHRDTKKSSIAMANQEEKPKAPRRSLNQDSRKKKKRTVQLTSSSKDDKDKDIMQKMKPFMGESQEKDDKTKDKEEESFGRLKSPEKSKGAAAPSNIDTKFDTFIRERKKSFELSEGLQSNE